MKMQPRSPPQRRSKSEKSRIKKKTQTKKKKKKKQKRPKAVLLSWNLTGRSNTIEQLLHKAWKLKMV